MLHHNNLSNFAEQVGHPVETVKRLFRIPEGHDYFRGMESPESYSVVTQRDKPQWEANTSIHPDAKTIVYHQGWGDPGHNNSLHTIRSLIAARDLGYHTAKIPDSIGGPLGNGAFSHLRLGFTGNLKDQDDFVRQMMQRKGIANVHDLVSPLHRDFWRKNHQSLRHLRFDLTPGSEHWKRLESYLRERSAAGKPTQ
jgi:hypothetical protein